MSGITRTTTDHETIKKWTEARGGAPSHVVKTSEEGDVGVIRIAFPEFVDRTRLDDVAWAEFFSVFDDKKLAFVYQEATSEGEISRFCRITSR